MSKIRNSIIWRLFALLLCCSKVRSDWVLDVTAWKDVPDNVAGFKPRSNMPMAFDSGWIIDFVLPKPDASDGAKDKESQKPKGPEAVAFHIEQNKVDSASSACGSILHEIGNLIPIALENVMNGLYRPINPAKERPGFSTYYISDKAKKLGSRFVDFNPFTTTPAGAARTDYVNEFPPPNVDSISIIISDYDFKRISLSAVSSVEPLNSASPSKRTLFLNLDWLRESWESPLPWQTPAVRRRILLELLTHDFANIYQYTRPDYLNVKNNQNNPPPKALIEGIAKFVTLQADLAWQGVKTPDLLGDLPAAWDMNSEHTAYFLLWVENVKYGKGSIARLNDKISKTYYWGREKDRWLMTQEDNGAGFWNDLFGMNVDSLWEEYVSYVDKEGYLSPLKWASYSIQSITTSPQNTFKWLRRIFFTIWRKFTYWKRFAFTVLHLVFRGSSGYMAMLVLPLFFTAITLPIYKLAYDRIRRSRPSVGAPISAFSAGVSLLISGLFRGWHGVRLLGSGMWVCVSGILFMFWHTVAALLRIEQRLYSFVSWAFDAVPTWFGRRLVSLVWLFLSKGIWLWIWLWMGSLWAIFIILLHTPASLIRAGVSWMISVTSANSELYFPDPSLEPSSPLPPRNDSYPSSPSSSMPTPTIPRGRQIRSSSPPSSPSAAPSPVITLPPSPGPDLTTSPTAYYPDLPIPSTEPTSWDYDTSYRSPSPPTEIFVLQDKEVQIQEQGEEQEEDEYRIEEILRSRKYGKKLKYRVKWYGKPADQKWYDAGDLRYQPHMLQDFHAANPDQVGPPVRLLDWLHAAENGVEPRTHPDDNMARK
ncbi:PBSP domain protein [Penicillium waksmanii]|uniref:PBSP domain protein n=1 Tax=Penicillium waksmanii TaxID=69791 RepID=UPI00254785E5|nr:PBSP domain protein [Penicillium waksmanii]KAJ5984175.1 PBSP domain protein [Penicillium waksmanii]